MSFDSLDRGLGLRLDAGNDLVFGEELRVFRIEPSAKIGVQDPVSIPPGVTYFGLESPSVGSPVYQLRGVVLPGWCSCPKADPQEVPLLPFSEFRRSHRGTTSEIDREPVNGIKEPGPVSIRFGAHYSTVETSLAVRKPRGDARTASEDRHRVEESNDRYVCLSRGICDGNGPLKVKIAVEEGVAQDDRIAVNGRDYIGPWRQILGSDDATKTCCERNADAPI